MIVGIKLKIDFVVIIFFISDIKMIIKVIRPVKSKSRNKPKPLKLSLSLEFRYISMTAIIARTKSPNLLVFDIVII